MTLLLDTCALIWLSANSPDLSPAVRRAMEDPENDLLVSPITVFEIGQKQATGKLTLSEPIDKWFKSVFKNNDLSEAEFSSEIAARAALLPPLHKDPFDRLLIATAMVHDLVLLTPDEHIRQYPGLATMW